MEDEPDPEAPAAFEETEPQESQEDGVEYDEREIARLNAQLKGVRFLKFCCRHGGEPHLPATGKTLRSGVGLDLGGVGGGGMPPPVTLAAPAELS